MFKILDFEHLLIYAKIQHISDSPTKHFAPILPYVRNLKSAKIQLPIKRIFVTLHAIQKITPQQ